MINLNDTDYEVISKVKDQLHVHEHLVDPDDIRILIRRFELLLTDYEQSQDDKIICPSCDTAIT